MAGIVNNVSLWPPRAAPTLDMRAAPGESPHEPVADKELDVTTASPTRVSTTPTDTRTGHGLGPVVVGSLTVGLVAAFLLVAAPFIPAEEGALTGAVLCGSGLGWAMLAVLSVRFTDHPQRWAAAPAVFMGLGGLLLVVLGSPAHDVLNWVWPPALLGLVVWMITRARRQLPSGSSRWVLYPVLVLLAVASIGGGYQTVREAVDANAHPMPGQLVVVGGHRLHLSCTGSGSPAVVLEPGAGAMSSSLGWLTPAVAAETQVCVYDRAGHGWSEPGDTTQDARQVATDLHTLLHGANVPGPYVLAGHSFGGLYALTFAARYPGEVAGLVLVDSTAPASAAQPPAASPNAPGSSDVMNRVSALVSAAARLGFGQLIGQLAADGLPPQVQDEVRARTATASNLRSTVDEYGQAGSSAEQAASLVDFGDKPLVVLTAGSGNAVGWAEAQDRLAALSTNSVHAIVSGATHVDLVADQEKAAATSQAIHDVLTAVRSSVPLQH
jgi:pimeloyl-ACP methyl ester carboxylesterase